MSFVSSASSQCYSPATFPDNLSFPDNQGCQGSLSTMSSPNYDSGFDSPQSNLFQCDFQQQSDQQVLNQNYQLFDGEFVNQGLGAADVPSYHAFQATFPANHVSEANFRSNHAAGNGAVKTDGGSKR